MTIEDVREETSEDAKDSKTEGFDKNLLTNLFIMIFLTVIIIPTKMPGAYIDYEMLTRREILVNGVFYFMGFMAYIIALLLFAVLFISRTVKLSKQHKDDPTSERNNLVIPESKSFKITKIIMWSFSALAFISHITYLLQTGILLIIYYNLI